MGADIWLKQQRDGDRLTLSAGGDWCVAALAEIDAQLRESVAVSAKTARIDLSAVGRIDTVGAWTLYRTARDLRERGVDANITGGSPIVEQMLDRIAHTDRPPVVEEKPWNPFYRLARRVGVSTYEAKDEALALLSFLGAVITACGRSIVAPARIRLIPLMSHIERVGMNALPIVGLLSFLIGIVLAYQGADQLRRAGAEIFTVDLLGVAILREMGVLLTAIIVAGRSGSAFAAQIGTMQVNQEIDAIRTLGMDPLDVLVLPRVFALLIAMPLLTVYADLMGIIGGMLMAMITLDITFVQFVERFNLVMLPKTFWIGMVKAPVFGFVIALVGCREGMSVGGSAESVGTQTTKAVVVSIFLVIVIDAVFSVLFSYLGV